MYRQSLLHYTFSKPEATFNFIKKLVKNNLVSALVFPLVSMHFLLCMVHPSYARLLSLPWASP